MERYGPTATSLPRRNAESKTLPLYADFHIYIHLYSPRSWVILVNIHISKDLSMVLKYARPPTVILYLRRNQKNSLPYFMATSHIIILYSYIRKIEQKYTKFVSLFLHQIIPSSLPQYHQWHKCA